MKHIAFILDPGASWCSPAARVEPPAVGAVPFLTSVLLFPSLWSADGYWIEILSVSGIRSSIK